MPAGRVNSSEDKITDARYSVVRTAERPPVCVTVVTFV